MRLEDYSPSFLSWVYRYIGHDPALVLATGASLAGTAAKKIISRIHKRSTTALSSTPFQLAEPSGSDNPEREKYPQQDQETDGNREAPVGLLHVPRSPSILHRPLVDEIEIPMPLDDSYEDNDEDQGLRIESEAVSDEAGRLTTCHGTAVKVYKNGRVIVSSAEFPLEFRTSRTQAQKICSFGSTPRIYFPPTDIEIRIDKEVVYIKPIERLLGSLEGAQWLSQLILEKQARRGTPDEDEFAEAEHNSGLNLISHERHGGTYKNGELKRKLLQVLLSTALS